MSHGWSAISLFDMSWRLGLPIDKKIQLLREEGVNLIEKDGKTTVDTSCMLDVEAFRKCLKQL